MRKIVLSQLDTIRASKLIEQHCKKVDGFAVWDQGWSDEIAAKAVDARYKTWHIAPMRSLLVGRLIAERKPKKEDDGGLSKLKANQVGYAVAAAILKNKHNALVDWLVTHCDSAVGEFAIKEFPFDVE